MVIQPAITSIVEGKVRIPNLTDTPIVFKKNDHIAQISPVFEPEKLATYVNAITVPMPTVSTLHSNGISLDPDKIL